MKKAASKSSPASLGSKRQCQKCATKFYDFGKEEIACPKCGIDVDPKSVVLAPRPPPEIKRAPKAKSANEEENALPDDELPAASEDAFESVEDLSDDEGDLNDVTVDDGENESY